MRAIGAGGLYALKSVQDKVLHGLSLLGYGYSCAITGGFFCAGDEKWGYGVGYLFGGIYLWRV